MKFKFLDRVRICTDDEYLKQPGTSQADLNTLGYLRRRFQNIPVLFVTSLRRAPNVVSRNSSYKYIVFLTEYGEYDDAGWHISEKWLTYV